MMRDVPDLRELVRAERRRRGWSVRAAATEGGCSNTTWGEWENGDRELGGALQSAVAQAFGWATDWPDQPPATSEASPVARMAGEVEELRRTIEALASRLDALEQADPPPSPATDPPARAARSPRRR